MVRRGVFIAITCWLGVIASEAQQAQHAPFTPEGVLEEIDSQGPRAVLARLSENEALFARVESGDPTWLEIARRLRAVSDASSSLALNYSVARALPRAPERVLALIGQGFTLDDVCTSPFIEPESGVAEEYARRAEAALRAITTPRLTRLRDECLRRIGLRPSR
jgi:hypothetical protein